MTIHSLDKAAKAESPPKKRQRSANSKRTKPLKTKSSTTTSTPPPLHIFLLDNGGDTLKFGWITDEQCRTMPNTTARLQQQWTVLAGDQLGQIQNPTQLVGVTKSVERGLIVNLGNQVQVWKRMLDVMGVSVPLHTDTAEAFGWKTQTARSSNVGSSNASKIAPNSCAVMIGLPPHCPRTILDQITQVWMEDFGFGHVGFCVSPVCAAHLDPELETCCLVDLGYSAIHIVPVFQSKVINPSAIRRVPIGGRQLIGMWKYYCSYRQWNLMDQEWILRDVLHKTAYVSMSFNDEMKTAKRYPGGRRPFDREFVLPDFQTSFEGRVQIPPALANQIDEEAESDDSSVDENDMEQEMNKNNDSDDDDSDDDEEEETVEQKRQRLLRQRQEEERRRNEIEAEQQVLNISVERFAIPEILFTPSDAGLPAEWAGVHIAVVQAISKCPIVYQAALYNSIYLVGGLANIPGLQKRLEKEIRALAPCEHGVKVSSSPTPREDAWNGIRDLCRRSRFTEWSFTKDEWISSSKRGAWKKLSSPDNKVVFLPV